MDKDYLVKWMKDNYHCYSWIQRDRNTITIWVNLHSIIDFIQLFSDYFSDDRMDVSISKNDIAFNFSEILEIYGIDAIEIYNILN